MHRRENHQNIQDWVIHINDLAANSPSLNFILPIHPNPNVRKYEYLLTDVNVIEPVPYAECIDLVSRCKLLITDSGGFQEESSFFGKRCIVCRRVSERVEGIGDFAFMCPSPSDLPKIYKEVVEACAVKDIVALPCPYGDGYASEKILEILEDAECLRK